jgi:hypothetical protein
MTRKQHQKFKKALNRYLTGYLADDRKERLAYNKFVKTIEKIILQSKL